MPYIKALERAGLSPEPLAAKADSYVEPASQLAIDWIRSTPDGQLAVIRLAGPYTGPRESLQLPTSSERYINPKRFEIPHDAWLEPSRPPQATTVNATPASPSLATEELPPQLAALNHHYESCSLKAYPDPASPDGLPITIGWGSTFYKDGSPIQMGEQITQSEADDLYAYHCRKNFWDVLIGTIPHWGDMNDNQRSALCSFAYNNGARFYGDDDYTTISKHLREHNWKAVPGAMMLYRNPGSGAEVGLGRRRRAEGLVWGGMEPAQAISQAERDINTPANCEAWEQQLIRQEPDDLPVVPPPSEAQKPAYDPGAPINWDDMNARVSRYFFVSEVTQNDRRRIPSPGSEIEKNIRTLAVALDQVRQNWGSPIQVTSWYRPPDINRAVGGVANSQHIYGLAADIRTLDGRDQEFEHWLDTIAWKDRALGYGVLSGRGFTHVDMRPERIRWRY